MRKVYSQKPSVLMPPSVASQLPATIILQAGNRSVKVAVATEPGSSVEYGNQLIVLPTAARGMGIPSCPYRILKQDETSVRIGPLVGILAAGRPNETNQSEKARRLYRQLILRGWEKGIFIYCFSPQDVSWGRGLIRGYTFSPNGKWLAGTFPIPDVVYNRILYRSTENQKMVQKLLEGFDKYPGVYLFNRRFLNKWEVSRVLEQDHRTRHWVPETLPFSANNLQLLLNRHQELFLKPYHSSRGQGIIKIERTHDGRGFRYGRSEWKGKNWIYVPNYNRLNSKLRQNIGYQKRYLIQQGIELARLRGRVFDLRAQAQKDRRGEWVLTGVGVRVAAQNRFVTHVPNGGSRADFDKVIKEVFDSSKIQSSIEQELNSIGSIVPQVLEDGLKISLGILSLDIGVDTSGKLWILEINSKPARFDETEIRSKHMQLLIDFFIFAAEHNSKGR